MQQKAPRVATNQERLEPEPRGPCVEPQGLGSMTLQMPLASLSVEHTGLESNPRATEMPGFQSGDEREGAGFRAERPRKGAAKAVPKPSKRAAGRVSCDRSSAFAEA